MTFSTFNANSVRIRPKGDRGELKALDQRLFV